MRDVVAVVPYEVAASALGEAAGSLNPHDKGTHNPPPPPYSPPGDRGTLSGDGVPVSAVVCCAVSDRGDPRRGFSRATMLVCNWCRLSLLKTWPDTASCQPRTRFLSP